jgi:predicted MFS family arabinose efflux permease
MNRRAVRYGAFPLVALAGTTFLESGERQSLAQAVDGIKDHFGVSDTAIGLLFTAMAVVAVFGAVPMGMLADRVRRTYLLAGAMVIWTACMALNALAGTYLMLFLFRMGVGAVEANGPAAVSLLADYYPAQERARRMGLYQAGALAGGLVGLAVGGLAVKFGGWRWAFAMWIPAGIAVVTLMLLAPEPQRGDQDADLGEDLLGGGDTITTAEAAALTRLLPAPTREPTGVDLARLRPRALMHELARIPSMWFGVLAITVSQMLLVALQAWGIQYFKDVHGLDEAAAGGVAALLGAGSAFGILGGGFVADRLLRRGIVNSRVYVIAGGSIAASLVMMPAFASTNLTLTAPLMFLGGALLTLPVAPAEALMSDVVVPELRGRAGSVRSIVRAVSGFGPLIVGVLSDAIGIRAALVAFCPVYAIGGIVMLGAARHYPADLAYVLTQSQGARAAQRDVSE